MYEDRRALDARPALDTGLPTAGRAHPPYRAGPIQTSVQRLGPSLLAELRRAEPARPTVVSPFSVYSALALAEAGAAGETRTELREAMFTGAVGPAETDQAYADIVLYLAKPTNRYGASRLSLEVANAMWLDTSVAARQPFLARNREYYGASIAQLDLAAPETPAAINNWIRDHTRGRIGALVDRIPSGATAVLANAVCLKASWDEPFERSKTAERRFHRADGSIVHVPTMWSTLDHAGYRRAAGYEEISLRFGNGTGRMTIFLPNPGLRPDDVVAALAKERGAETGLQAQYRQIALQLPRFRVESMGSLVEVLRALGVRRAFDPVLADFSEIAADPMVISDVMHGAFAEVNEDGLDAAAATVGFMTLSGRSPDEDAPKLVVVDRPFVFQIDFAHLPMFIGVVEDPSPL